MLLRVETTNVDQRCDYCGANHNILWTALRAGVETSDPATPLDPNVIELPTCSDCGSKEFLVRVFVPTENADPATREHRHHDGRLGRLEQLDLEAGQLEHLDRLQLVRRQVADAVGRGQQRADQAPLALIGLSGTAAAVDDHHSSFTGRPAAASTGEACRGPATIGDSHAKQGV